MYFSQNDTENSHNETQADTHHLIVGAGAVGAVFGAALLRAGERVAFRVKPKYVATLAKSGLRLLKPRRGKAPAAEVFSDLELLAGDEAVRGFAPNYVWLCMSAVALEGAWLEELLAAIPRDAQIVVLQPGAEAQARVQALWPAAQTISGLITFLAWESPLPGESHVEPGIAWWLPPGASVPLAGAAHEQVAALVRALRRGGLKARRGREGSNGGLLASAVMMPHIAALEARGWRLSALWRHPQASRAAREAARIVGGRTKLKTLAVRASVRSPLIGLGVAVARCVAPFDLEAFLQRHFMKVRDQTRWLLDELIQEGKDRALPTVALEALRAEVFGAVALSSGA